jgi:hypothetical protein
MAHSVIIAVESKAAMTLVSFISILLWVEVTILNASQLERNRAAAGRTPRVRRAAGRFRELT